MTAIKNIIGYLGLSQAQAATHLAVSIDTVKAWCAGRRNVPDGVWRQLQNLDAKFQDAATHMQECNERYEFDTELEAPALRALFPEIDPKNDLPDSVLIQAFSVAKIHAPMPPFIEKNN